MNYRSTGLLLIAAIFVFFPGCAGTSQGKIISPSETETFVPWTKEELKLNLVGRKIRQTKEASFHRIHLRGAENPHIHRDHDLTVVMLSGKGAVHFKDRTLSMKPGDIAEIPRGEFHWAENKAKEGSEVYAIFMPPYDGKDYHEISAPEQITMKPVPEVKSKSKAKRRRFLLF